jgi:site-specific DNA-cytosine methylase
MIVTSLFDGISVAQQALLKNGVKFDKYYASEIDRYCIKITQGNFPQTIQIGDVKSIENITDFECGLLVGGSPCQDISIAHKGAGIKGSRSSLFYYFALWLKILKPKYFLFENVVPAKKEWLRYMNKKLGVEPILINADLFVQQNRPRLYWTNIPIKKLQERPDWQEKYYQYRRNYFRENKSGVSPCLMANMGTGGHNVPLRSKNLNDRLSVEECEALQGLPRGYTDFGISRTQRLKAIGNAWCSPVIEHIFKGLR